MKICYLPGRERSYSRTRVLLKGMTEAGIRVIDCSYLKRSPLRYIVSFFRFLKEKDRCDVIFVGFFGQFIVPFVKIVTRKKILFDAFLSTYQTMTEERKAFAFGSLTAKFARFIDKFSAELADKVFLDTDQHIDYYSKEYGLNRDKFLKLPAGSDDSVMNELAGEASDDFIVHLHGEFQALHGAEYVMSAAKLLPEVKFQIIGKGNIFNKCRKKALSNTIFISSVSYRELAKLMAKASVCLGIFGDTRKADMVVPNKVYEALAMGKALVTADTPAVREVLIDGENALFCRKADPESLAKAIKKLKEDPVLRKKIALKGNTLFKEKYSSLLLGKIVLKAAEEIL